MLGSPWVAAQLAASQEGLGSMSEWGVIEKKKKVKSKENNEGFANMKIKSNSIIWDNYASTGDRYIEQNIDIITFYNLCL
jgi:hypothetical protein